MGRIMRVIRLLAASAVVIYCVAAKPAAAADVVVVVSAQNPLTTLTKNQVTNIFLGKSKRFPKGAKAKPIDMPEGNLVRDAFYSSVIGKSPAQIKAHWSKLIFTGRGHPPQQAMDDAELKKLIANDLAAIAYIEKHKIDDTIKVLTVTP